MNLVLQASRKEIAAAVYVYNSTSQLNFSMRWSGVWYVHTQLLDC